jgi:DNA polymerase V
VLSCPYKADTARIVVREMCEQLVLDLVARGVATRSLTLTVGYDRESLSGGAEYTGNVSVDHYGRLVPYHSHGTVSLPRYSSSTFEISGGVTDLFDKIVNKALLIRRLNVTACDIRPESFRYQNGAEQMSMFVDYSARDKQDAAEAKRYAREKCGQRAMLLIKNRFGKNSIFRAMDLLEGATTLENNERIGGHRA